MVPLPLHAQRIGAETVVRRHLLSWRGGYGVGLVIGGVGYAVIAKDGPVVHPHHGLQVRHTPQTAEVLLQDGPPLLHLSVLVGYVDEGSLVNGVGHTVDILLHQHLLLVGAEDVLGAENSLSAGPSAIGGIDIVIVANLIEVTTLQAALVADDLLFLNEVEVLVKLAHENVADAAGYVYLAVIEQHARIVVSSRQLDLLPFAFGVGGRQQELPCVVAVDKDIELAVVVFHRAGPHALCIGVLAILQVVFVFHRQLLQRLCTVLPVQQVFRLHDGSSREVDHRRADHVIGVSDADDVRVGEVGKDNRVFVRSVASVTQRLYS